MEYRYLDKINSPHDLKQLPRETLPRVCEELRDFIIQCLSHNPGHLASSLGAVELTVALHYVFDTPSDQIVWDVGHQAYAHKILTGRRNEFSSIRCMGGLAPFPTPEESEYDAFVSGHASNSISAALGIEVAGGISRDKKNKPAVVAVIGDGAMTGGLAFEGLNNTSMDKNDLLIILNDNHMAIDPIRGGFSQYLVDLTTSNRYNRWRWWLYQLGVRLHLVNDTKKDRVQSFGNAIKTWFTHQPNNIFQGLKLRYFGPTDGHDVIGLVRILTEIKHHRGPRVLHIITTKGKGYRPAEQDQTTWHAPGEFDPSSGERKTGSASQPLWQEVFGNELLRLAKENPKIVGITPAMLSGCSMSIMQAELPDRVFDVGIAEGHAVTFAAGMAKGGLIPVVNEYSSFLQRAYDQLVHDVALTRQHVIICVDRAGIVGHDGATHHGLLDLTFLRSIPNMRVASPRTAEDLKEMMQQAVQMDGPVAIRYPRGKVPNTYSETCDTLPAGKARPLKQGNRIALLTIGAIGNTALEAARKAEEKTGADTIAHWDMRWLKPIDTDVLDYVGQHYRTVVTVEDGMTEGGLGSAVSEYMSEHGFPVRVVRLGVRDRFVPHGSPDELYHLLHLDTEGLCESLLQAQEK